MISLIWIALLISGDLSPRQFQKEMDRLIEADNSGGFWGVVVYAPLRDRVMYEKNAERNFRPPSHINLVSAILGFHHLGPDYRFKTQLGIRGHIVDGILEGDLVIRGGGDPSMGEGYEDKLTQLAAFLKARGVQTIRGDLVVMTDFFEDLPIPASWEWDKVAGPQAGPSSSLYLNHGLISIDIAADLSGRVHFTSYPPQKPGLELDLRLTHHSGEEQVSLTRIWGTDTFTARGNLPPGRNSQFLQASWQPALQFGRVFGYFLEREGVRIEGTVHETRSPGKVQWLDVLSSAPLDVIVATMLKQKQTHFGSAILNTTAREVSGLGSFKAAEGLAAVFLDSLSPQSSPGLSLKDGSGMSVQNYLKPRTALAILRYAWNQPYVSRWLNCFPRFDGNGSPYNGGPVLKVHENIRAASGSQFRASDLYGYGKTQEGEPLIFTIMVNNHRGDRGRAEDMQEGIYALITRLKPDRRTSRILAGQGIRFPD